MSMTVDLGALEPVLDELVANGRYGSRNEVLKTGVRLLQQQEAKLMALKAKVQLGLDDIAAGRVVDVDEAFDAVEQRLGLTADE
jgi:antitoxin ParD1/3/4